MAPTTINEVSPVPLQFPRFQPRLAGALGARRADTLPGTTLINQSLELPDMKEPASDLARYAFGYSDRKPGATYWAILGLMAVVVVVGLS